MAAPMHQNPLLTLDALKECGCVLPTEVRSLLDVSLELKARELGVQAFLFWGKFTTTRGYDYYIARAYNGTKRVEGQVVVNPGSKFYYSRDGMNWLDIEPISDETRSRAAMVDEWFTGDPSHVFEVPQPVPEPEAKEETGEDGDQNEEEANEEEPVPLKPWEIKESDVMQCRIDAINAATALAPEGMFVTDPYGNHRPNPAFFVKHPEQLSSYSAPSGNLGAATPGKWGIRHDAFRRLTTIRSFEYPGFFAFYSGVSNTVGNLYFGDGLENKDLGFCAA
jgi:radial spoke head protein 9